MNEEERKKLSNYLENYGAYDLADEFNTQVYMVNTQEFNDLVLLYYFIQKDEIEQLQQENKQLKDIQDKIMEIIDLNQYNYGYQIKNEITKEILDKVKK